MWPSRASYSRRTARALMVMPFSRSRSIESSTWLVIWRASIVCVSSRIRSASVDLPWSTWAMIEKLRRRAWGMLAMGPPEYSEAPLAAHPGRTSEPWCAGLRLAYGPPDHFAARVGALEGWFCPGCKSLNCRGARRCYSCGGSPEGSKETAGLPLQMNVPMSAIGTRTLGDDRAVPAYHSANLRAAALVISLTLSVAVTALLAVVYGAAEASSFNVLGYLSGNGALDTVFLLSLARVGLWVVTAVLWFTWFDRVLQNVPSLGAGWPASSRRGAMIWWFVPVLNLFRPVRAVGDAYQRLSVPGTPGGWLPTFWWLAWIGAALVPLVGERVAVITFVTTHPTLASAEGTRQALVVLEAIGDGLEVMAGVLAVAMVIVLQRAQKERAALMAEAPLPTVAEPSVAISSNRLAGTPVTAPVSPGAVAAMAHSMAVSTSPEPPRRRAGALPVVPMLLVIALIGVAVFAGAVLARPASSPASVASPTASQRSPVRAPSPPRATR